MHNDNISGLIFSNWNIYSVRNKFYLLKEQIKGNIDTLMISETKFDDTFSHSQ